jgi:ketosteroid isomerase-like protein
MSENQIQLITHLYERFNARDIDGVLVALSDDVAWANGMEGGHVHGLDAIRDYWTRQWALVSPHVEPVAFKPEEGGVLVVEVIQTLFDLDGNPLGGEVQGLKDKTVFHVFTIRGGMVARFDIREAA